MWSFFIPVPESDQEDEKQFEERNEEEAVRRAENFNDGAHEKASERGASEKYEGVEAHDAAQVIRRAGQLDRGVAVDHEKNDGKSDKSEDQERRDVGVHAAGCGKAESASGGESEQEAAVRSFRSGGGKKAAREGAGADGEEQRAESVNAAVQDAVGKERAIGAEIQDERAYNGHGEEIAPYDRILFA